MPFFSIITLTGSGSLYYSGGMRLHATSMSVICTKTHGFVRGSRNALRTIRW